LLGGGHLCQLENAVLLSVGGQGGLRVGKVGHHVGATQVQLRSLAAAEGSLRGKVSDSSGSGPHPPPTKCFSSSSEALSPSPSSSSNNQVSRWGPDRILPASSLTTSWPDGRVEIRGHPMHPSSSYPTMSVWTMLKNTVARVPDRTALAAKRNGQWVKWTFAEYEEQVRSLAKAFIHLGLKKSHSVCIIGFNAPEWHISCLATVVAGGLTTGIYTTNSPEAVRYVVEHSRANFVVVEDKEQLDKIWGVRDELEHLVEVVQWDGKVAEDGVLAWGDLIALGRSLGDDILEERLSAQATNQPCMLVYTSGTTGRPKGVMMSQDNITWTVRAAQETYDWVWDSEEGVTYLPLSHVAAQIIDIYLTAYGGATVWFADNQALQGSLIHTLKEVRPTRFFGVPRVWEKIQEKMMEVGRQNTGVKKAVAEWAKAAALKHNQERMAGREGGGVSYWLARRLILARVHEALGLDRAAHPVTGGFYSSAAPLSTQTFNYFLSLDMPVMELLGSSETGGPQTACLKGPGMRQGSVGKSYPHFETTILNPDQNGVGEICTRGRNVFLGYLWDEEKTKEVIDSEGWVHSGDLGRQDEDGFFYVCGRMKEILITGGGENVAPVPIEDDIKAELGEVVSQAMLVGDQRKHLAVLLTLRTELDGKGQPTDKLHPEVISWLNSLGSTATSTQEVVEEDNMEVRAAIKDALDRVNKRVVSKAAHVRKFLLLQTDFSMAGGELTPTLKVKRHIVSEKYAAQIDEMYQHEEISSMW